MQRAPDDAQKLLVEREDELDGLKEGLDNRIYRLLSLRCMPGI